MKTKPVIVNDNVKEIIDGFLYKHDCLQTTLRYKTYFSMSRNTVGVERMVWYNVRPFKTKDILDDLNNKLHPLGVFCRFTDKTTIEAVSVENYFVEV